MWQKFHDLWTGSLAFRIALGTLAVGIFLLAA
jgi:hypothetical protein